MGLEKDVRLRALAGALQRTPAFRLREIQRWYSKEFHTPLYLVPDVPLEDLLQAWWESEYVQLVRLTRDQGLDAKDRVVAERELLDELKELTESDEERRKRLDGVDLDEISDDDFLRMTEEEESARIAKVPQAVAASVRQAAQALDGFALDCQELFAMKKEASGVSKKP